ncbi:MAG: SLBB domain-containing protein, partial [Campylobacterales bacterium]|nr:SLBB domain-containing protein [Campylobacterales bacterium]
MFKKIISVLFLGFVFLNGAEITLEDMQKYEQYKSMIADVSNPSNENKQIKTQNISNMIQLESNDTVNVIDSEQVKLKNLFLYDKKSIELKRFADNFFANKNPLDMNVIPTSNNYILNNGDTIMINTYGVKSSKNYELKVDNNGNINIPNIGLLKIVSLSLAEAKTLITNTISKAFPNTKVIVDISGYSSIQVVLAGNIKVPGIYNLSSFSTIKDAIIAAGGVQDYGSYRQIDLVRNGKVVFNFDLYKLITEKNNLQDITLRSGDRLMVGFAKKIINLSGKVKNEAIFELTENETFEDLMKYSGGFRFDATKES